MKVLAILLVIGVSWVAAHPGLFDWQDNANKLIGGFAKNDIDEEHSAGSKKGLLGPVKGIFENVNSWGSKLIPAPILDNEIVGKLDVLNLLKKEGDEGIVKDSASPVANIFGEDNMVGSIISSAVGTMKESVLGDVVEKFKGEEDLPLLIFENKITGFGGGTSGKKTKSSRKSNYQKSSEHSEKEFENEKESGASSKSESLSHNVSKEGEIDEKIAEESDSEEKEESSEKEIEDAAEEESSEVEKTAEEAE